MASSRGFVVGRELVKQLDIGRQRAACEDSFKQVVTQQNVFRRFAGHGCFENVEVVNSLAGIGAFVKKILVYVRDR